MNDFHMMSLANDIVATRRVEADRARLVRSGQGQDGARRRVERTRQPRRANSSLGALFHRVALW